MRTPKIPVLIISILGALVVAGCGGSSSSSGVSAKTYVADICNAVAPFERDVVARSSALDLTTVKGPTQGKAALQSFLTAIAGDTDNAVTKLKAAGTPNVKHGSQISSAIVGAFTQLSTAMHKAVGEAKSLSTTNATAFKNGATHLGNDVRSSMSKIGSNLQSNTLKSPELQKAAASATACKSLGSS
jgi:hypothetical protein